MHHCRRILPLMGIAVIATSFSRCRHEAAKANVAKPVEVIVAKPARDGYTEFEEFSGHIWPAKSVEIRARVSGQLDAVQFVDGSEIATGQKLFQIDPRSYQATVDKAEAAVRQAKSRLDRLEVQLSRARTLINDSAISQEEVDILESDRNEAEASHGSAVATLELARLDLSHTQIVAPMAGRISRRMVDPGNLIRADETLLATLLATNPVDAYFDVDERTVLRIRRQMAEDPNTNEPPRVEVLLSVADRNDFTLRGTIDFVDNQLDASSGTLRVRAKVDNSRHLLSPGMFVRCRYPMSGEIQGLFVPEEALGSDQGQPFLYVVNGLDEVEYRRVVVGPLVSGRRVVKENLGENDRVIVAGLQRVRPGIKVTPRTAEGQVEENDATPSIAPTTPAEEPAASPKAASVRRASDATVESESSEIRGQLLDWEHLATRAR